MEKINSHKQKSKIELKDLPAVAALPILRIPDKSYFIDLALKQFREVDSSFNYIDFDRKMEKYCANT
ncbi:MAG: hypothetical protein A2Y10_05990 [Planctomycetes bacterium GWF2_41_51]|nr:MAG: hypothetical protein A2Y10_05990 [Planctomycetes bacterium GWF2_41_51]